MDNQSENPYSPPKRNARIPDSQAHTDLSISRIFAALASAGAFTLAFAGYVAWAVANFYQIASETQFIALRATTLGFVITGAYWAYYVVGGYRQIPPKVNNCFVVLSAIYFVPAGVFILWFFV